MCKSVDILGDRFVMRLGRSLFGVVGLLRGDRFCGESVDVLGDCYLIEIGAIAVLRLELFLLSTKNNATIYHRSYQPQYQNLH